jgi:hypothetical protein
MHGSIKAKPSVRVRREAMGLGGKQIFRLTRFVIIDLFDSRVDEMNRCPPLPGDMRIVS